jgi:hypothetical protein
MTWQPLHMFSTTMKDKLVRFKSNHTTANLSNQLNNKKTLPAMLSIPAGSIGIIYQVNGGTMYIGFDRNLRSAPSSYSPAYYAATIQFYIADINKLEIEN